MGEKERERERATCVSGAGLRSVAEDRSVVGWSTSLSVGGGGGGESEK